MAGYRKLSRTASQRKALLRGQVTSFLYNGKIDCRNGRIPGILRGLRIFFYDFDIWKINYLSKMTNSLSMLISQGRFLSWSII